LTLARRPPYDGRPAEDNEGHRVSKPATERRAHRRVETSFPIDGTPEAGGAVARMIAKDLSLGGLRCMSSADYPEMTRLAVTLLLPLPGNGESTPVSLEAVVVRREPAAPASSSEPRFELSLFFTRVDDTARSRLASFLGG
jgi:PilZ domain